MLPLRHVEVPRLGVKLDLQLPPYTTATATQDLRCVCDLHHSSQQHPIFNPLREARDWTHILMVTNQVCYHWATTWIPYSHNFLMPVNTKNLKMSFITTYLSCSFLIDILIIFGMHLIFLCHIFKTFKNYKCKYILFYSKIFFPLPITCFSSFAAFGFLFHSCFMSFA